ncbi:Iron siderophore sensor protein [Candidatus Burkholderia brachyanthoides]|nr:Iron siderophore sensor protein [Candidatus Burkholderia brachyanthoides]
MIHPATVEQAAQWIVRLTDDDEAERSRAREGFDAWKRADPRHATAAAEIEHLIGTVQGVRTDAAGGSRLARAALDAAHSGSRDGKRRRVRRIAAALAIAFVLAMAAWVMLSEWSPAYLMADLHTSTGQWETRVLSDGTRITLNTGTAVNLHYDARRRAIELVQGEILVDVAKDAARPFLVETADGSMRALGTRFVVDREPDATVLSMIRSRVAVQTTDERAAGSQHVVQVAAGERVRITASGVGPIEAIDARRSRGRLGAS